MGYAFMRMNERTLFYSSEFIPLRNSVKILLLNTMCPHAEVIRC